MISLCSLNSSSSLTHPLALSVPVLFSGCSILNSSFPLSRPLWCCLYCSICLVDLLSRMFCSSFSAHLLKRKTRIHCGPATIIYPMSVRFKHMNKKIPSRSLFFSFYTGHFDILKKYRYSLIYKAPQKLYIILSLPVCIKLTGKQSKKC